MWDSRPLAHAFFTFVLAVGLIYELKSEAARVGKVIDQTQLSGRKISADRLWAEPCCIDRYISSNRIIDLTSKDLKSAYAELVQTFDTLLPTAPKRKKVLKELVERKAL